MCICLFFVKPPLVFSDFVSFYETDMDGIKYLKQKGLIKKFGVSVYSNEELEKVLEFKEIDLIQLPFNILDNNNLRGKIIQKAKNNGVEVHTRSTFLQGLFFKDTNELKNSLKPLKKSLNFMKDISKNNNVAIQNLALGYVYSQKNIDNVLIGVDTLEQLEININSIEKKISNLEIKEIEKIKIEDINLLNPSNW